VALVDKERTRLFTVFMGQIEEGRAFEDAGQRTYLAGHLKRAIRALSALHKRGAFDRLVLAGPEEATSELRALLPRTLAARVVDVIPMPASAGSARILAATLEVERRVEREAEGQLITDLLDAVEVDGLASCDLVPTIHALELRAIRTLVVADGLRIAGSECPDCGWLEEGTVAICPIDGFSMRANDDIVDVAVRRTLVAKGTIEVVHDTAARRLIESCGGIGAALRFRAG
jgi:peptide subunit release factor 1 (eRF1)